MKLDENPMGTNVGNTLSLPLYHTQIPTLFAHNIKFLFCYFTAKHSVFSLAPFSHIIKSFKLFTKLKVAFLFAWKNRVDRIEMMRNEQRVLCP